MCGWVKNKCGAMGWLGALGCTSFVFLKRWQFRSSFFCLLNFGTTVQIGCRITSGGFAKFRPGFARVRNFAKPLDVRSPRSD